jgi:hypothetical protein
MMLGYWLAELWYLPGVLGSTGREYETVKDCAGKET